MFKGIQKKWQNSLFSIIIKLRIQKTLRRIILNGYKQAAGKKTKKIKWVKKKRSLDKQK